MLDLKAMAQQYGLTNWIDTLYEADFNSENQIAFLLKVASVAAAIDLAETTPLTEAYQQRLLQITEVAFYRGMEALDDWSD
jgi:putative effector of murein hydrolase